MNEPGKPNKALSCPGSPKGEERPLAFCSLQLPPPDRLCPPTADFLISSAPFVKVINEHGQFSFLCRLQVHTNIPLIFRNIGVLMVLTL